MPEQSPFRAPTPMEEKLLLLREIWIGAVQLHEYDRIIRYIGKSGFEGRKMVFVKTWAMNVRRMSAAAAGVAVGLAAKGVSPDLVQILAPTVVTTSLLALGINAGIDRLIEGELKE